MSRSWNHFVVVFLLFSLCSCNGEPPCFNPPLLTDSGGLGNQVNLDADALSLDTPRDGSFSIGGKFSGHVFGISGQTSFDAMLTANQDSAAPALALYGPRSHDGLFGRPIAQTCGVKGQESRLTALMLERPGDYLILTADPAGILGDYSLELSCNSGCQEPQCQPLVCDLYCPGGLARAPSGCPICECTGCLSDEDCPLGYVCDDRICLKEDPCRCDDRPYDPVCGVDNHTYANQCELDCAGVDLAHDGVCPPGCASDSDCPAGSRCVNGECIPVCDCEDTYIPVCGEDGQTYFNDCYRLCAGVPLEHTGECLQCNPEVCDGLDNDCDGIIDDGVCGTCNQDADCHPDEICWNGRCVGALACQSDSDCPAGQECVNGICRGASGCDPEECDGIDNDCDGIVDEGCPACRSDADCAVGQVCNTETGLCELPCEDQDQDGWTTCNGDCDDLDSSIHPEAPELCDGIDNDCDGPADEGFDLENDPQNCGDCGVVCGADETCQRGMCVPTAGCTSDADCDDSDPGTEDHCLDGICVFLPVCSSDADCLTDQICWAGICLGHGSCVEDADCPAGEMCEANSGVCVRDCRAQPCPAGQYCHQDMCAP